MVHRVDPAYESPEKTCRRNSKVKTEAVDSIDDQFCSLSKRPKLHYSNQEEGITRYNPLDEPSPLGLKLKKSPSFLDLIQMKLSQERSASLGKTLPKKEKGGPEKIKASNFPATLLTIGSWEYKSRYEGDLVAKCYFAKHKLVWEVLDGGLKNKIEIQWSDIMAIKATYPDDGVGTLDVVLSRQPLFFREINPQPRKHTLWQATTDFTSGQATINRRHYLQFPQGILGKHFEKLMQCDPRLRFLSQQPEIVLDTPYFQSMVPSFRDRDRDLTLNLMTPTFSSFKDTISVSGLSSDFENTDTVDTPSSRRNPSSVTDMFLLEGESSRKVDDSHGLSLLNQIKVPGLHPSMSVGDLVNHIGECISEQMRSDNPNLSINESQKKNILEEITQYLLSDSQTTPVSDEGFIMSRVNSLCCLLQKESNGVHNLHDKCDIPLNARNGDGRVKFDLNVGSCANQATEKLPALDGETGVVNGGKEGPSMSRNDSVDELLMNLPRIASLPQFLINAHEESVHGGR